MIYLTFYKKRNLDIFLRAEMVHCPGQDQDLRGNFLIKPLQVASRMQTNREATIFCLQWLPRLIPSFSSSFSPSFISKPDHHMPKI